MLKKLIYLLTLFLSLSCSKGSNSKSTSAEQKPNVIIVLTDDQGYGDVGAHGNSIIKTPNIDAFYKESYHLTDFHVGPTCAPTRSALMTGRYANSVGVWHTVGGWSLLRDDEKTIADMFSEAGYATGAFGKWHLGDNYPYRPQDRGFQETVMHGGGGVYQTPDYWGNTYFDDTYFHNGKPQKYKGYCTDVFFDEATSFIKRNKEKPFFCYLATNAPHGPYNVPVEYYNLYKDLPKNILSDVQKRFYGMITNVDDNFGKLRKTLNDFDLADNTILIFMTDNGTSAGHSGKIGKGAGFNAGMRGHKGSEYEGGHRVPFFIHWKDGNIAEGKDINELTAQIDILPTLTELCGIDLPQDHKAIDGESIVPLIRDANKTNDRMLITDSQRLQVPIKWRKSSVMQNKWRLVNGEELYNIEDDKGQENDLSEKHPERVEAMRAFYENWWQQVSVDFDKEVYIPIGTAYENPVTLTAHDVHAPSGGYVWNQVYIREGNNGLGYWSVDVTVEADYTISMRRYPIEADLPINAEVSSITTSDLPGLEKDIPEGVQMNYIKAQVKIENQLDELLEFSSQDKSVDFKVHLKPGKTKLWADFFNENDEKNVAYYVYIEKV